MFLLLTLLIQEELQREPKLSCRYWGTCLVGRDRREHLPQHWRSKLGAPGQGRHTSTTFTMNTSARMCSCLFVNPHYLVLLQVKCLPFDLHWCGNTGWVRDKFVCTCPSLSFSLLEHVCGSDKPGRHVLRQHLSAGVVPQPGAAQDTVPVSECPGRGAQHGLRCASPWRWAQIVGM